MSRSLRKSGADALVRARPPGRALAPIVNHDGYWLGVLAGGSAAAGVAGMAAWAAVRGGGVGRGGRGEMGRRAGGQWGGCTVPACLHPAGAVNKYPPGTQGNQGGE